MSPVTHALLPMIIGCRWLPKRDGMPSLRAEAVVGVFGMMPDILNPHISLDARHHSWSHTLLVWAVITVIIAIIAVKKPALLGWRLAALLSLAYLGHLACDAISGGIAPLLPFSPLVVGAPLFPFRWWFICDFILLFIAYVLLRVLPMRRKQAINQNHFD